MRKNYFTKISKSLSLVASRTLFVEEPEEEPEEQPKKKKKKSTKKNNGGKNKGDHTSLVSEI